MFHNIFFFYLGVIEHRQCVCWNSQTLNGYELFDNQTNPDFLMNV